MKYQILFFPFHNVYDCGEFIELCEKLNLRESPGNRPGCQFAALGVARLLPSPPQASAASARNGEGAERREAGLRGARPRT